MSRITHCPACAAPVSPRAVLCALCDHVIDPDRLAAATRAADQRSSQSMRAIGPWRGIARSAAQVLAVLAFTWIFTGVTFAGVAAWKARSDLEPHRGETAHRLARLRESWPRIDAAARRAAAPARHDSVADRQALRELVTAMVAQHLAAAQGDSSYERLFDIDPTAIARYGAPQLTGQGDPRSSPARGVLAANLVKADAPARLADSVQQRLAADSATPWLAVWRRVAQAGAPRTEWAYRPEAPGVRGPVSAPVPGYAIYKALAGANASAALLEVARGRAQDRADAVQRARENVAMAHVLSRGASMMSFASSRMMLRNSAALLVYVGRAAHDTVAVADGLALEGAVAALDGVRLSLWPTADGDDPDGAPVLAIVGDTALPPAVRAEAALSIVTGTCQRTNEVLLGPASARTAAMRAAADRLADVDPDRRVRPLYERAPDEFRWIMSDGGWTEVIGTGIDMPGWAAVLESVGLGDVATRAYVCANIT